MRIALEIFRLTSPALMLFLLGCGTPAHAPIDTIVQSDLEQIYSTDNVVQITLQQAVERALVNNLDAKIAEQDFIVALSDSQLQKLNALPTITAKREYIRRSNNGASSSISAETGVESLEPSISTDQSRRTNLLEANWDVLDSAINIYKSKSAVDRAIIAQERLRKVRQNIYMDVHSAFYRAAMAQRFAPSIERALVLSNEKLDALDVAKENGDMSFEDISSLQSEILTKRRQIQSIYRGLSLADFELKALLSLPPEKDVELVVPDDWLSSERLPKANKSIEKYIVYALEKRPEIREELLNLKISRRNLNTTIYETFPGLSFLVSGNQDDNSFLLDSEWINLTATLSQSITRILTLPARYQKAKRDIELADARRRALVAAVISQVYIAKALVDQSYGDYNEQVRSFDLSTNQNARSRVFKENGLLGGFEEAVDHLDYEIAKADRFEAFANASAAHGRLLSAIGFDVGQFLGLPEPKNIHQHRGMQVGAYE